MDCFRQSIHLGVEEATAENRFSRWASSSSSFRRDVRALVNGRPARRSTQCPRGAAPPTSPTKPTNRNRTQEPQSAISSRKTPTKPTFHNRNRRDAFHQTVRATSRRFRNRTHGLWSGFSRHDSSDGKLLTHKNLEQEDNTDFG